VQYQELSPPFFPPGWRGHFFFARIERGAYLVDSFFFFTPSAPVFSPHSFGFSFVFFSVRSKFFLRRSGLDQGRDLDPAVREASPFFFYARAPFLSVWPKSKLFFFPAAFAVTSQIIADDLVPFFSPFSRGNCFLPFSARETIVSPLFPLQDRSPYDWSLAFLFSLAGGPLSFLFFFGPEELFFGPGDPFLFSSPTEASTCLSPAWSSYPLLAGGVLSPFFLAGGEGYGPLLFFPSGKDGGKALSLR